MRKKIAIFGFILLLIVIGILWVNSSKRHLNITGYAIRGDDITVTINQKNYPVDNHNSTDNPLINYLYKEIEYYNLKNNDIIHVRTDSTKQTLLDTLIELSEKNIQPRLFFKNPHSTNFTRKVDLVNDSSLIVY